MDDEELKGLLPTRDAVEEPRAETDAPEASQEPQAAETPETQPAAEGPARGPDGKFASKATPPEPGHVPLSAMLDEREKRQALEKQLAEIKSKAGPPPPPTRDEQLSAALYDQNLRASRRFAEREYGKDIIETVHDWAARRCDADPAFNQQMRSSDDPYESAYQAYSREQVLAEVKAGDLDAFKAWKAAQAGQAQATAPPPSTADAPLPRSLATAPGAGAGGKPHVSVGEGEAFAATIKG